MIQIYKPTNDNFKMNGDACLHPLSCYAEMNLNGAWTLTLENNIDDNIDLFVKNAVISAPTPFGDNQLFRIYNVEKSIASVKCIAYPIFLDARYDCFLHDVRPTNKNGQDALQIMVASNPKYSASSNITKANTSYYLLKNLMEAINGDDENSFINRWGGEIIYKNFEIIINERIGSSEKNLICKRGLNQLGIVETVDTKNLVTRIIPKGFNGRLLPNNESVDSDRINAYPIPYIKVIEYSDIKLSTDEHISESDTVYNTLDELYQGLRERAKKEFTDYQIDIPDISYDVEMIDQYELDEYKMFKEIMKCNLGDDLICHDEVLNIHNIKARIIQIVYDCINKRNISLKIGKYTNNFFDELSRFNHSAQKVIDTKDSTLVGERLKGILNLLNLSLKAQKDVAQKQDVRAIQFEDLNPNSPTFGAMCLGTQGIQIAKRRNETNTDWVWGTAINFEAIIADYIMTGILTDKKGNNSWNLDTGYLVTRYLKATDAEITGKIYANSGTLAGFTFDSNTMTATITKTFDYTQSDLDTIESIILNGTTPTVAQLQRLDVSGDGRISALDMVRIHKILDNGNKVTTTFRLNPDFSSANNNVPILEISNDVYGKTSIDQLGFLYSKRGDFGSVYSNSLATDSLTSNGYTHINNEIATLGHLRINEGWIGFHANTNDANSNVSRKGWFGHDGGTSLSYVNEAAGYLQLKTNGAGIGFTCSYGMLYFDGSWRPQGNDNGSFNLGESYAKWKQLYATTATIATSDRNEKKDFTEFDERYEKLFFDLKPQLFKYKNGESNRFHSGFVSQDVEESLKDNGLTALDFAGFCKDKKQIGKVNEEGIEEFTNVLDENGEQEYTYSLRYEEFIPLNTYMIQKQQKEIDELKKQVEELKSLLKIGGD